MSDEQKRAVGRPPGKLGGTWDRLWTRMEEIEKETSDPTERWFFLKGYAASQRVLLSRLAASQRKHRSK